MEWLGQVPEHWEVLPIKRIVATPITDGPHETPQFVDEGIPFVSAEAVSSGRIDFSKVRACISAEDNARYSLKYSPQLHDIYMVKSGATTGITAIVEGTHFPRLRWEKEVRLRRTAPRRLAVWCYVASCYELAR